MLNIGSMLDGKYQIVGVLGQGGWGKVYLAENVKLGNKWAIKEIDLSQQTQVDLLAEPEILKKLNHPSLPRIVDIVRYEQYLYVIEDFFQGVNLKELIEGGELGAPEKIVRWANQLCQILIYLHNLTPHPIIYGDMKPGNIIIDQDDNVKLIDFGVAREYKEGIEGETIHLGTKGYAAPEQYLANGQLDERTDIYSLGATLYHLITGKNPAEPSAKMIQEIKKSPASIGNLGRIVAKCLESDPRLRYQRAEEVLQDLQSSFDPKGQLRPNNWFLKLSGRLPRPEGKVVLKEKIIGSVTVALGGTNRGVGCTHLTLGMAAWLAKNKYKVAVVELNENPVFFTLEPPDAKGGLLKGSFQRAGVDFYRQAREHWQKGLLDVLRAGYNYVLLDLGRLVRTTEAGFTEKSPFYEEFERADLSILVAGAALWQLKDLAPFLRTKAPEKWQYVFNTPDPKILRELREEIKSGLFATLFAPDPFQIRTEQEPVFRQILKPVLPTEKVASAGLKFWK